MKDQKRQDFEDKVNNCRYATAKLVHGDHIEITDSYMQNDVAVFWGKYKGHMGVWLENQLTNFCF